jgi:uncharacterized MAPEG superfamily protein
MTMMTLPFWCVLIAGLMPFVATLTAKSRRDFDNANPREWLGRQEGFRARAHAAQLNSFETFPLFAAAVVIAHLRGANPGPIETLALGFIGARALFIAFYIANLAPLRSLAWFVAMGCIVAMFFVGAPSAG